LSTAIHSRLLSSLRIEPGAAAGLPYLLSPYQPRAGNIFRKDRRCMYAMIIISLQIASEKIKPNLHILS